MEKTEEMMEEKMEEMKMVENRIKSLKSSNNFLDYFINLFNIYIKYCFIKIFYYCLK